MILKDARLFLGPEPPRGAHPGWRGTLNLTPEGVLVRPGEAEMLIITEGEMREEWPAGKWEPLEEVRVLIPWHRIDSIEYRP